MKWICEPESFMRGLGPARRKRPDFPMIILDLRGCLINKNPEWIDPNTASSSALYFDLKNRTCRAWNPAVHTLHLAIIRRS